MSNVASDGLRRRPGALFIVVLLGGMLGGCGRQYMDRSDRIEPTAGDSVQANVVTHVIDPWPQASRSPWLSIPAGRLPKTMTREAPSSAATTTETSVGIPSPSVAR